jgi:hypothetical protein
MNARHIVSGLVASVTLCVMLGSVATSQAVTILVPGTSNPWLAGMPNGSTASIGDVAPAQSPVLVNGINLTGGSALSFSATGLVSNGPGQTIDNPDGGVVISHLVGVENGIADATAGVNSLMGVFLDNAQPNLTAAPGPLAFSPSVLTIAPGLKQPFFIGDGLTGTGTGAVQRFIIPSGATRFFLGTMDGFEWNNNTGSFDVSVTPATARVPEASDTFTMLLFGVTATLGLKRLLSLPA